MSPFRLVCAHALSRAESTDRAHGNCQNRCVKSECDHAYYPSIGRLPKTPDTPPRLPGFLALGMIEALRMADDMHFRLRKGLDLPMAGRPEARLDSAATVASVAIVGDDYVGLEPRLKLAVGDRVRAGDVVLEQKRDPHVRLTAPGSGAVTAVNRGARRVLKSVVIELDDPDGGADVPYTGSLEDPRQALLESGLWCSFRTRPYGRIPASDAAPHSVFVTAMDTRPLAGDPQIAVGAQSVRFSQGLEVLRDLTEAPVYLCTAPGWNGPKVDGVRHATFEGPHPAGLPSTHIHHVAPVGSGRAAWHLGWQDVIAIGRLFGDRVLSFERVIALGGDAFAEPRMLKTRLGADLIALTADEWRGEDPSGTDPGPRLLSGSPLCGRVAEGSERWLGRYHDQVCALRPPLEGRRLRWRRLLDGRFTFAGTFDRRSGACDRPFSTDQNGRATALVPIDAFEKLIPMDVLTEPLLRALLIGDTDQAQALGCLELVEEDLALCSFICPGKNDYGAVLRVNLDLIELEG